MVLVDWLACWLQIRTCATNRHVLPRSPRPVQVIGEADPLGKHYEAVRLQQFWEVMPPGCNLPEALVDSRTATRVAEVKWCLVPQPGWTERSKLPMVVHSEYLQHSDMPEHWLDACQKLENIVPAPLMLGPLDERHDAPSNVTALRCSGGIAAAAAAAAALCCTALRCRCLFPLQRVLLFNAPYQVQATSLLLLLQAASRGTAAAALARRGCSRAPGMAQCWLCHWRQAMKCL